MELIFELSNRAGHALELRRATGDRITIGRGYDNDIILQDETVDAQHAVIEQDADGQLVLIDLDSRNGIFDIDHQRQSGPIPISSGSEYLLGHARLRILDPAHPVPPALRMGEMYEFTRLLDRVTTVVGVTVLAVLMIWLEAWLNTFAQFRWQEVLQSTFSVIGTAFGIAMVWALIGKVVRHETHLRTHFAVLMVLVCGYYVISFVSTVVGVNTLSSVLTGGTAALLLFVLVTGALATSLYLATRQPHRRRWTLAAGIAAIPILGSLVLSSIGNQDFSEAPSYNTDIAAPVLRVASGIPGDEFVDEAQEVFSAAAIEE
ncbi:MAG: FHA domain-containing protein [Gammaproteobacteria bacterium]|nr:FHA domain-containing protein [Gammaproteobacteria bacterium]